MDKDGNVLLPEEEEANKDEEYLKYASTSDIISRTQAIIEETKSFKQTISNYKYSINSMKEEMKENVQKINLNKDLPYLVANVVEILDLPAEEPSEEDEILKQANISSSSSSSSSSASSSSSSSHKCAVVKSSMRTTYFLPEIGLVNPSELVPGDLVGVKKETHLIIEKLPPEYDQRVTVMEIDEKPQETFSQIGGLSKQIEDILESIIIPFESPSLFSSVGIKPPKGILLYGPPGTGKTLMARAVANRAHASFLKLAAPQLVQMYVGDGAKMVRDAFRLAREKAPSIIFIDELDAIGTKRSDSEHTGDREVTRTMLELLNQLDGFNQLDNIKVIAATNRVDVLDPALLRSGRIDRKIELPNPNLVARAQILRIHSRSMIVHPDVNYDEIANMTDDFNGAQLKAVCVEAGMIALRRGATQLMHEDFVNGVAEVQAKKKTDLHYYV